MGAASGRLGSRSGLSTVGHFFRAFTMGESTIPSFYYLSFLLISCLSFSPSNRLGEMITITVGCGQRLLTLFEKEMNEKE
jgi:hypothetical protein